jgi:hypothetical protein
MPVYDGHFCFMQIIKAIVSFGLPYYKGANGLPIKELKK